MGKLWSCILFYIISDRVSEVFSHPHVLWQDSMTQQDPDKMLATYGLLRSTASETVV